MLSTVVALTLSLFLSSQTAFRLFENREISNLNLRQRQLRLQLTMTLQPDNDEQVQTSKRLKPNGDGDSSSSANTSASSPSKPTMVDTLTFLSTICGSLKNIKRTGWVRHNVPLPESDSDHMHRCAMCAMIVISQDPDPRDDYSNENGNNNEKFHPSKIDGIKLLRMAVTHDLCESLAGDITPFCDAGAVASKHDKEHAAMAEIRKTVGDPLGIELFELWKEYEAQETVEALYCKDIDKFEMVMQAYEYEKAHLKPRAESKSESDESESHSASGGDVYTKPMRTFFITTNSSMKSPIFRRLDAELRTKREEMLKDLGWDVTSEERQKY